MLESLAGLVSSRLVSSRRLTLLSFRSLDRSQPVTGSAHCTLGPYFAEKLGKTRVVGRQASARGGVVECVLDDEDRDRITIVGDATIVAEGTLLV